MTLIRTVPGRLCLFFFLPAIQFIASCSQQEFIDKEISSFEVLKDNFSEVPASYRPVPFWVWNEKVSKDMIDEQMKDFASHGFGGVFVHPRYGLITEYASDDWYDFVDYARKKAKKLGLFLWLYDENSFPSGFGGGHVPVEMPSSYNEGHALKMHRMEMLKPDEEKEYLLVFEKKDTLVDITDSYLDRIGETGDFVFFEKCYYPQSEWYAGYSYVDLLKPGVTEKFIEVTMEGYRDRMDKDFGNTIPGIFTDEPNIEPAGAFGLIRWTPDLFEQFEKTFNYRLEARLYDLLVETEHSAMVRHNYNSLLLDLFIERWSKPWYEYTEENDLLWTGHYWEHGWPLPVHGPDNMAMYAWHQVPGIDMLFNNWEARPDQFGNIRAVRELNSAANQMGRKRRLSETYGASGHELTFKDMKLNGDWEFVLGVNMMNQHLSYQSMLGDRKHDFPQTISYHAPYWDEYPVLNEYFSRLSFALSCGEQNNNILVLEPTTSAWMLYSPMGDNRKLSELNRSFTGFLKMLEEMQVEYDLGSERIIKDNGKIEDGRFVVGKRKYNTVILPEEISNLDLKTAELILEYVEGGGNLISFGSHDYIEGHRTTKVAEWQSESTDNWFVLDGYMDRRLNGLVANKQLDFLEQNGGMVFHQRRELDEGDLLFLVNSSDKESSYCRILSEGIDLIELDLFTGKLERYPCVLTEGILSFDINLDPAGSILLFISNREELVSSANIEAWKAAIDEWTPDTIIVERKDKNVVTLDYCSVIIDKDTLPEMYFYNAQTAIFQRYGFEKNPWVSSSQFKQEIVERDTFSSNSGFRASYSVYVDSDFQTKDISVVVERPELYKVFINSHELHAKEGEWWLDKGFGVFPVTDGLIPGINTISIEANPMSIYCELEPVYLVGDFDVWPLDKGWLLDSPGNVSIGSWKNNGMPFYGGEVAYTAEFNLKSLHPVKLLIDDWEGSVIRVRVNQQEAGIVMMKPGELRLDDYLKVGKNSIEVIVNGSLKNTLGPHHNIAVRGIVTPWSFKSAPEKQVPGREYDLLDYGLLKEFRLALGK